MLTEQIEVVIYHCLCCGEVICQESDLPSPECCGQTMTNAVKETVDAGAPILGLGRHGDAHGSSEEPHR